jgi:hypothetical protein
MADLAISQITDGTVSSSDYIVTQRSSSNFRLNLMASIGATLKTYQGIYNIVDYGAVGDGSTNDRVAIQAAHDAAEADGGGTVFVPEGIWAVYPTSGISLLFNGDKVKLKGTGPNSIIRFITSGTGDATVVANNFEGVAPKGYNTATTNYGASGLWIEDIRLEADTNVATATTSTPSRNAAGLVGIIHSPWAIIRNVTFGDVVFHQIEINRSRNILIENCNFVGNTESTRVQFDIGLAAQKSATPTITTIENVWFENCRFAGRDVTTQNVGIPRLIELDHTGNMFWRNINFNRCEFGAVYNTTSAYLGYSLAMDGSSTLMGECLNITNCTFLGDCHGQTVGIYIIPGTGIIRGIRILNNRFIGGYDCNEVRHAGGFYKCITIGANNSASDITGSSTVSTNYSNRTGIVVRDNFMAPRFVKGNSVATVSATVAALTITTCLDAVVENNYIKMPVVGGDFTAAVSDILTTTNGSTTDGMMVGDPIRFTTTTTLPAGLATATTYYVREILSNTTFTVASSVGGSAVDITSTGTGTHSWVNYLQNVSIGLLTGSVIAEIANLKFSNNTMLFQHDATNVPSYLPYCAIFNVKALEAASVLGWWEVTNNRLIEVGIGSCGVGMVEYSTSNAEVASPYIRGRWAGNVHEGTFSSQNLLQGHPAWFDEGGSTVLTADTASITSTTLAAQISTRVMQSGRYKVFGKILYTTAAATDGIKLALNGPATTTLAIMWSALTADTGEVTELYTTTDGATFTTTTRPATGTAWLATVSGYATFSAAGVISIEAASEIGSSTILKAGSFIEISSV